MKCRTNYTGDLSIEKIALSIEKIAFAEQPNFLDEPIENVPQILLKTSPLVLISYSLFL